MCDRDPSNGFRHPCTPAHGALVGEKKITMPPSNKRHCPELLHRPAGQSLPRGIVVRYKAPRNKIPTWPAIYLCKNNCGNCYVGSATGGCNELHAPPAIMWRGKSLTQAGNDWRPVAQFPHSPHSTPHLPINSPSENKPHLRRVLVQISKALECAHVRLGLCQRVITCPTPVQKRTTPPACQFVSISVSPERRISHN